MSLSERINKMFGTRKYSAVDEKQDVLTANVKIAVQRNEQAGMKVRETLLELLSENDKIRRSHNENNHT
jgi:hypothetical protein